MVVSPAIFLLEPRWQYRRYVRAARVPHTVRTWLYNDDSLTSRLKTSGAGKFRVEVLQQRFARIQRNEERVLGVPHRQHALLREVYLYCGDTRVVYARSVIPLSTLTGRQKRLATLGDKPLGGFLFACPSMQREEIELAELGEGDQIYDYALTDMEERPETIWGRRSIFRLAGKPLLVAEIFLPGISVVDP